MRTLRRTLALALGVVALAAADVARAQAAPAAPDTRATVAVIDFTNGAIGPLNAQMEPLRMGIADLLATELAGSANVRVVERTQLKAALEELRLGQTASVDAATAVQLGKLLNAHHIVTGTFVTDAKGRMRLATRVFRTETSEIEHTASVTGKSDDLLDLLDQVAGRMTRELKFPPLEVRAVPAPAGSQGAQAAPRRAGPPKLPMDVALDFGQAVKAMDSDNRAEAVQLFRRALAKMPDLEQAKAHLARLEAQPAAAKPGA